MWPLGSRSCLENIFLHSTWPLYTKPHFAEINIVNHVKEVLIYFYWVFKIETGHWISSNAFSASIEMSIFLLESINIINYFNRFLNRKPFLISTVNPIGLVACFLRCTSGFCLLIFSFFLSCKWESVILTTFTQSPLCTIMGDSLYEFDIFFRFHIKLRLCGKKKETKPILPRHSSNWKGNDEPSHRITLPWMNEYPL